MDIEKIKTRDPLKEVLTIRISEKDSKFLRENRVSPSGLFRESIKDLRKTLNKEK